MKIKLFLPIALILAFSCVGFAQTKPTFKKYAVKIENIKNIKVNLKSHKNANNYRTNLRNAAKGKVNFAGHYILTTWGCGTNCTESAMIDARNGAVFFPAEFQGLTNGFCELPENAKPTDAPVMTDEDYIPLVYKSGSRLLVLSGFKGGAFDDKKARCGTYFLEWTGKNFKQVSFIAGKRTDTP